MRDNSAAVKIPVEYVDDLDPKYKDFRIAMLAKSHLSIFQWICPSLTRIWADAD